MKRTLIMSLAIISICSFVACTNENNKSEGNVEQVVENNSVMVDEGITEEEKEFIKKEIETLKASIAKRKGLLANQNFVSKAPLQLVEQEKEKLALEEEKLKKLEN